MATLRLTRKRPMDKISYVALFLAILGLFVANCTAEFFEHGKTYVYEYEATSSSGVLMPSKAQSSWGFHGLLVVKPTKNVVKLQFQSLKVKASNGPEELDSRNDGIEMPGAIDELQRPFGIEYKMGQVENFSIEASEAVWATNIKRSVAGILQLDLNSLKSQEAFRSLEANHYGRCTVEYVVTFEEDDRKILRKSFDPRTCLGHPSRRWSNVPHMPCSENDQDPVLKASERFYEVSTADNKRTILGVNATGEIYVQPFQSLGVAQFLVIQQRIRLLSVNETIKNDIHRNHTVARNLQHDLPDEDLTQGRSASDKASIFKSISALLDRLSRRLETPGLDTNVNNLHNTTVSVLLFYLGMLDMDDLQKAYNSISGTSYKEETVRNMFLEVLPQVGSTDSTLFVLKLIQTKKVSDITALQLLTHLPFHVRKPDVQLLVNLQPLLELPDDIASEVQHTGILTYGTLIYKTCMNFCPYEMLDDYVHLYLDKFTASTQYEKKMVWLEGLSNIQLGRVVEFLEPIASGNSAESRHLRVLAAWASLPTAPLRPDVIYPVYWPILVNRTEHLEMRIAALTLLIASNPSPSRLISLYWYLQGEPSQHLYNYFYTTVKSMERTHFPCYAKISSIAAQLIRILKAPSEKIITGNYVYDYKDSRRLFGTMLHGIVIANAKTNIPEVTYLTLVNHGTGFDLNHVSLYVKAEGFLQAISTNMNDYSPTTRVEDILKQFKFDRLPNTPVHVEIIARVQQKAVFCLHLNQTNLVKAFKYVDSLRSSAFHMYQNVEFHVNQQRIRIPLMVEAVEATDLGTNVRLAVSTSSLFSMRGNFTHVPAGRNNHVILRTSIRGSQMIETYNPLGDLWHAADRSQSIHGYMPINVTLGFKNKFFISYNTPEEEVKVGFIGHVRTVTNVRGFGAKSKMNSLCPTCPTVYTVRSSPKTEAKSKTLFNLELPELGGSFRISVFDCEEKVSGHQIISDVISSHQSNRQVWSVLQAALLGIHFVDYLSYVPPSGSCGLQVYAVPNPLQPSEVKFQYMRSGDFHMFSLTRTDRANKSILQQWNLILAYESKNWTSNMLKIKATSSHPREKVMKICIDAERTTPWDWDILSTKPSNATTIKLNTVWGYGESAKGKCSGSSLMINLRGEVTEAQITESKEDKWPYNECRKQLIGKSFVPYTDACYEASRELSTLRKYTIFAHYENLPKPLEQFMHKLKAVYDLTSSDENNNKNSNEFLISATFPKDTFKGVMQLNEFNSPSEYDMNFINTLLARSGLHKYMDNPVLTSFFGSCILTPKFVRSTSNITTAIEENEEKLLLARCDDGHPQFAISLISRKSYVELLIDDESDGIRVTFNGTSSIIYNYTNQIELNKNFDFTNLGSKWVRRNEKFVDVLVSEVLLFVHWTQEQVVLFFPNYIHDFTCGLCSQRDSTDKGLYGKI